MGDSRTILPRVPSHRATQSLSDTPHDLIRSSYKVLDAEIKCVSARTPPATPSESANIMHQNLKLSSTTLFGGVAIRKVKAKNLDVRAADVNRWLADRQDH